MQRENEEEQAEDEYIEEEHPHTQRFSVVVVWSPGVEDRISASDLRAIIGDAIVDLDEDATVEVTEIPEPTY